MRNISSLKRICLKWLATILSVAISVLVLNACGNAKPIPIKYETIYTYKDSVNFRDSTIYHHLYKEYYKDYTGLLDTLYLETSYSQGKAYVDTTAKTLKGELENKDIDIPIKIKWKEKIVYRDSIVYKEVPVPVEKEIKVKPKSLGFLWGWFICSIVAIVLFFLKKFGFLRF